MQAGQGYSKLPRPVLRLHLLQLRRSRKQINFHQNALEIDLHQQCVFITKDLAHKPVIVSQVVNSPRCYRETTKPAARRGSTLDSNTLSVFDRTSGQAYLVDTGAEVSVYPASTQDRSTQPLSTTLTAANGTSIRIWGKRNILLSLGPKRNYNHEFCLADVTRPILGADFFTTHGLAIDLGRKRRLSLNNIPIFLQANARPLGLSGSGLPHRNEFSNLLQQFPELLISQFNNTVNNMALNITSSHIALQLMLEPGDLTKKSFPLPKPSSCIWKKNGYCPALEIPLVFTTTYCS